eukprot:CAMPEP_0198236356 /NCGR_PEP_ID=MMETSP1446-20131203/2249_1 /TAXON_ID=1461542 ORGANISM="Unidentified sp, Strain CCMP2111" /NCGR_SAMPLE_ID=MMETSP1446 /ASSEMBLY_ACC=CAM_ASM_001112 /LENGTH=350 /DNA_ID=CAMNT_0043918067 /DNA_START=371 /DNA_END=1420 /DNA_ORIENTATION=-
MGKGGEQLQGGENEVVVHPLTSMAKQTIRPRPHQRADPMWDLLDRIEAKLGAPLELSNFRLLKKIGSGAVASVYLVELPGHDARFALKILSKRELCRRNKIRRTIMEHSILCSTDHPFVVTLYRTFSNGSVIGFLMEYCMYGDMFQSLHRQPMNRLQECNARVYAAQVLVALQYMHVHGYVYRDLKPENILLSQEGHIKLTDFDLSRKAAPPSIRLHQGKEGGAEEEGKMCAGVVSVPALRTTSFVGTDEYIAPEIITGRGYTCSVDWWSLGILIYEMVYGMTPFAAANRNTCFRKIIEEKVAFPVIPKVSDNFKDIIMQLLCKDPKKRLGSTLGAAEIIDHPFFADIKW